MDPLAHTLTGAAFADAGLARRAPRATVTLLLAANLPDVDSLSYFISADLALGFRRGWTHGVLAMAILPAVIAAAITAADRWRRPAGRRAPAARFSDLLPIAYLGTLTHPLLDWLNTYGIRLLMPFDGRWFYGDTLFIIDPWLWLGLGGAVFLCHSRSRRAVAAWAVLAGLTTAIFLLGSAGTPGAVAVWFAGIALFAGLRARRGSPITEPAAARLARGTLMAASLYVAVLYAGSVMARHDVEAHMAGLGVSARDVMVGPLPIRPLSHAVVIDTGNEYRLGSYDWLATPRFELDALTLPKPPAEPRVAAALRAPCLRGMVSWMRYPWVEIAQDGQGHVVYLMDARYTRSRTLGFGGSSVRLRPDLSDACDTEDR